MVRRIGFLGLGCLLVIAVNGFSFQYQVKAGDAPDDFLTEAFQKAADLKNIRALAIAKDGKVLREEYFNGASEYSRFQVRSVTKSIVSSLLGIAIDKGLIENIDVPLCEYYPYLKNMEDSRKSDITLRHLLTMTSGFEWSEEEEDQWFYPQINSEQRILDQPMASPPGQQFYYNSATTYLLARVIEKATGEPFEIFADKHLLHPMGIKHYQWDRNRDGEIRGGAGLQLTISEMLKFGQLYLQKGGWEGTQLVSETWVNQSLEFHHSNGNGRGYGLLWWVNEPTDLRPFMYVALGYGCQLIMNIPEYGVTIAATHNYWVENDKSRSQMRAFAELMPDVFKYLEEISMPK